MNVVDVLPRDAIPSVDDPSFGPSYFGEPDDDVLVVEGDPARAYPVRILNYHEIVNDVLDAEDGAVDASEDASGGKSKDASERLGRPIAVTWCPICNSAVVFERVVDDRVLTFGTSGKLADDALVMYDRETGSEWKQPLGRAIDGPLAGRELAVVPAALLSFEAFREAYPDGVVLQPVHGGAGDPRGRSPAEAYDASGYEAYDAKDAFGLRAMRGEGPKRTWDRTDIDAKTRVLGVVAGDDAVGYPLPVVRDAGGVVSDAVGDLDVVVVAADDRLQAFEAPGYGFELRDGRLHGDGTVWDPATGRSEDGRRLARVPTRWLYAFAWQDDHGPRSFYGLD